ncbi:DUF5655 domain-containing protein [Pseudidiomarina insulisalsae]|uniref:DUF5655 domain-containing protein n=1 Tax=Pseudidiomarina insulisalsae TaxID=575789 RepID=A0A432YQQ5_9GAMM|nr:DUF5655 domain-containing protein [Pseudidiomarina insulisalsae]RUO63677.1 hypothetical protein CWI71_01030 [Pseudidiomarina insulisalsae]
MKLYSVNSSGIQRVKSSPFKLERSLQSFFEKNLNELMGLTFVKSEHTIKNKRIDTLAFDEQSNSFIIIEYKRGKNNSVIDQGFSYLSLMLENKAEFLVTYNEHFNKHMKMAEIDWSQTRVAFVSPSFTQNQIQATNFKDIGIELWEVQRFENGTVAVTQIKQNGSATSIKAMTPKNGSLDKVVSEIKTYTETDHLNDISDDMHELYEKFRDSIVDLSDDIEVRPQKNYIALKKNGNIVCIEIKKNKLKLYLGAKVGTLDDPKNLAKDVSKIGHWGTGDYLVEVQDDSQLEYILSLIKQLVTD